MAAGRPTDYDPAYCEVADEFLAEGYSLAALAGHIGTTRQSIYNWMDSHPEFFDAVKTGQAKSALWWEKVNRNFAMTGEGNATAIVFGLKNRAPEEWRDMKQTELTGANGGPINVKAEKAEWTIVDPETPGGA